jgi:hypothetical protein
LTFGRARSPWKSLGKADHVSPYPSRSMRIRLAPPLFFCFTSRHPSAKRICDGGKDTEIIKPKLLASNKASTNKIKHFGLGSESLSPVHSKPPTKAKCERFIIVATQKCSKAWGYCSAYGKRVEAWSRAMPRLKTENRAQLIGSSG